MNENKLKYEFVNKSIFLFIAVFFFACSTNDFKTKSEDISFLNKKDGIKLLGTISKPIGNKKFPAVLLIQGSGALNRNEEVFGHKPFKILAEYLSKNGIAVLRFDKRGCGESEGKYIFMDIDNFVEDALEGINFLKNTEGIDSNNIGLIGHSLGSLISCKTAILSKDVQFIVSLAGPGLWGKDILYHQNKLWAKCSGVLESEYENIKALSYRIFDIIMSDSLSEMEKREFEKIYFKLANYFDDDLRQIFYPGPVEKALFAFRTKEFRKSLNINPTQVWNKVDCSVLAINGSLDYQISAEENLEAIKNALISGGNNNIDLYILYGHNHMFQRCITGKPTETIKIKETISPQTLDLVTKWILNQTD